MKKQKQPVDIRKLFEELKEDDRKKCTQFQEDLRKNFTKMVGDYKLPHPVFALIALNNIRIEFENFLKQYNFISDKKPKEKNNKI